MIAVGFFPLLHAAFIVTESLMSVKDSNIEALKAENLKLKSIVDSLKEKIIELDISRNKLD